MTAALVSLTWLAVALEWVCLLLAQDSKKILDLENDISHLMSPHSCPLPAELSACLQADTRDAVPGAFAAAADISAARIKVGQILGRVPGIDIFA